MLILPKSIFSLDTNATKYFPLKVGNTWVFEYIVYYAGTIQTSYKYRATVLSDTVISGKKYYLINNLRYVTQGNALYRIDSVNGAFTKFTSCTVDSLGEASFNSEYRNCTDFYKMKYDYTQSIVLFGVTTTSILISINEVIPRISKSRKYAKNFGLYIHQESNNLTHTYHTLIGCVINGVLWGDTVVTVNGIVPVNNIIPADFKLHQNYPNPFNPSTSIRFDIASPGFTTIEVYDVLGRRVSAIVNENLSAGSYSVNWEPGNLNSGVYFYLLRVNNSTFVRKLVYLK